MHPVAPPVEGQDWLTCDPIRWETLRGRVVIVVFWSFGCEASLLRLRQVEAIVAGTDAPVTAIAVHTPRFPYEETVTQVRSAVAQHRIGLPVVHDPDCRTWSSYNPEGWPATIVVDGRGRVLGSQAGTADIELITETVAIALKSMPAKSSATPAPPEARPFPIPDTDLAYPTSVTVRPNGHLIVTDSGHDRLLLFELEAGLRQATAIAEIGGFDRPYDVLSDDGGGVYLSEPALGSVSFLDLDNKTRQLITSDLASPTSLAIDIDGSVVVTDSGAEKLYRIVNEGPYSVTVGLIAGSGSTGCRDGEAGQADLAQPIGIARTEVGLVFCDAASSNIRLLTDEGKVATITGNGLFAWGLVDGPAHKAMLQRPSDLVVLNDGSIIVVDTGNNRLRRLASRRIRTLGLAGLNRPAGVCSLPSGHLVVADTGNHRLVVVDTDLQTAWPLVLNGVLPAAERTGISSPAA